jgi:hypothetical protein
MNDHPTPFANMQRHCSKCGGENAHHRREVVDQARCFLRIVYLCGECDGWADQFGGRGAPIPETALPTAAPSSALGSVSGIFNEPIVAPYQPTPLTQPSAESILQTPDVRPALKLADATRRQAWFRAAFRAYRKATDDKKGFPAGQEETADAMGKPFETFRSQRRRNGFSTWEALLEKFNSVSPADYLEDRDGA